jgi:poly(A) polymerase
MTASPEKIFAGLGGAFFVGGAVRDAILGRVSPDIDIAVSPGKARACAQKLAKAFGGNWFTLDEETGVYRVNARSPFAFQIDVAAFQGKDMDADLRRRDFTVNSAAYPVTAPFSITQAEGGLRFLLGDAKKLLDPLGAARDCGKKTIAPCGKTIFRDDPLRMMRVFRNAAELDFSVSPALPPLVKKHRALIDGVAGERVREELLRTLAVPRSKYWLEQMDGAGLLTAVFPELEPQRKCALVYYGKGGVLRHTLDVVDRMEYLLAHLPRVFPEFKNQLAPFARRASILKFAALLHDIAKPATAKKIDGRLRFFLHEEQGARMAEGEMRRLHFSKADMRLVCAMIAGHLRPGHLATGAEITPRAVYRYFRETGDAALPLLLLCWADYASYLTYAQLEKLLPDTGREPFALTKKLPQQGPLKTLRHMQLVNHMFRLYFSQTARVLPQRVIDGNTVMKALRIKPGRVIGRILDEISLAQVDGKVKNRADALAFVKKLNVKKLEKEAAAK